MSSTDNPPSLVLSDIMHHMSPSPAPPEEHSGIAAHTPDFGSGDSTKDTFISSEAQSSQDVAGLRRRLNELGFSVVGQPNSLEKGVDFVGNANISPREKELLDMVISLSQAVSVDPSQLERQAETIANLTTHRDFLAGQIAEERERWQSERDSWDRTAEALLTQRNKPSKSEDIDRVRASYESENRILRVKLQDSQKRQLSLESELTRLKPLLFLQPFALSRQDKGKGREFVPKTNLGAIPEDTDMKETTPYDHHYQSQSQSRISNSPATASTSKPTSATQPSLPLRRSREHSGYSKSSSKRHCQTLTSDAYTEHLLLAAKKIGRKRAAIVTGIMQHTEREKEVLVQEQEQIRSQKEQDKMEQDRQERIASGSYGAYYRTGPEASTSSPQRGGHPKTTPLPRTPKRNTVHYSNMGTGSAGQISTNNMESSLVYVNVNTATSSYDSPWAGSGVMGTPGQIKSALNRQNGRAANSEKGMANNPTTPLASLLDAALMMNEDGRTGTKQRGKLNGKGRPLEEPESPMSKRRKTSSAGKTPVAGVGGLDRVKSALDVLADQADQASAAFNETDQSDKRSSTANESQANLKGKGKAKQKAQDHAQNLEDVADGRDSSSGYGQELIFVTSSGRGRPRRDSAATRGRASTATPASRPARQNSRKRASSPDNNTTTPPSGSTRGSGSARARGRPKTSTSRTRADNADSAIAGGASRMISPAGLRVIAHAPRYSPLDEALAMANMSENGDKPKDRGEEQAHQHHEEHHTHPHPPSVSEPPHSTAPKFGGLRPVIAWGNRNPPSHDSDSSPIRGIGQIPVKQKDSNPVGPSSDPPKPLETVPTAPIPPSLPEIAPHQDAPSSDEPQKPLNGDIHVQNRIASPSSRIVDDTPVVDDPDPHAEVDEDPDAEGEQEEGEDEDAEAESEAVSSKHTSRSKSPPPPDPPPPGSDNGSPPDQQDDHDTDADAEGEMDFEDAEDPSSQGGIGSTSSASNRKAAIEGSEAEFFSDLVLQFFSSTTSLFVLFSYVTPSFHHQVPTPLSFLDPTTMRPPQMLPDISENKQLSARPVRLFSRQNKSRIPLLLE